MTLDVKAARSNVADLAAHKSDGVQKSVPSLARLKATLDEVGAAKLTPRCIVDRYLYVDVSLLIAQGGTGKTTLLLHEMIHVALGRELWGHKVVSPGKTLLVSAEDSREILLGRLREIMKSLELSVFEQETVLENLFIWDVAGETRRLIEMDRMVGLTSLADDIVKTYREEELRMVTFDPAISFGASEQAINDNEQGLVTAARRLYRGLGCCVRYIHHTSQNAARGKVTDQYAGRGGTAMADGSRMVTVLTKCDEQDLKGAPKACLANGEFDSVLTMSQPKLSYCSPVPRLWIRRSGYRFDHFTDAPKQSPEEVLNGHMSQIERFLCSQIKAGTYLTRRNIEDGYLSEINMTRQEFKKAIIRLEALGRVRNESLPDHLKQGSRKTYLHPDSIAPCLETGTAQLAENTEIGAKSGH